LEPELGMYLLFYCQTPQFHDLRTESVSRKLDNLSRVYATSCRETLKMPSVAFLLQIIKLSATDSSAQVK
jgi:hypothetical protein